MFFPEWKKSISKACSSVAKALPYMMESYVRPVQVEVEPLAHWETFDENSFVLDRSFSGAHRLDEMHGVSREVVAPRVLPEAETMAMISIQTLMAATKRSTSILVSLVYDRNNI